MVSSCIFRHSLANKRNPWETADGDDGMVPGSCPNRAESSPMNTSTISLVLQNYFPDNPNNTEACVDNSAPLISMMNTCYQDAGKRWPNFIAVDFYQVRDMIELQFYMTYLCSCSRLVRNKFLTSSIIEILLTCSREVTVEEPQKPWMRRMVS